MKFKCACCGYKTMELDEAEYHEICPVCFWENDPIQNKNENYIGGANQISLIEAKANYALFGAITEGMIKYVRPPFDNGK